MTAVWEGGGPRQTRAARSWSLDARNPWHRAGVRASDEGFVPLFNGRDLTGRFATPRTYAALWPGGPTVAEVAPGLLPARTPDDPPTRVNAGRRRVASSR